MCHVFTCCCVPVFHFCTKLGSECCYSNLRSHLLGLRKCRKHPGADSVAWQPDTCQAGRLVRRPGGPIGPPARWAATSNVEIRRVESEGREGSEGQSHKDDDKERGSGMGRSPRAVLGYMCRGPRVPSYATADGAGLPT